MFERLIGWLWFGGTSDGRVSGRLQQLESEEMQRQSEQMMMDMEQATQTQLLEQEMREAEAITMDELRGIEEQQLSMQDDFMEMGMQQDSFDLFGDSGDSWFGDSCGDFGCGGDAFGGGFSDF